MVQYLPATAAYMLQMKEINETELPENYPLQYWAYYLGQNHSMVAIVNDKTVGYCLCSTVGDIVSFAVSKEYQGKGHGKQLLQQTIALDPALTYSLHVRETNLTAFNLYRKLGFQIKQVLSAYYQDGENGYEMVRVPTF